VDADATRAALHGMAGPLASLTVGAGRSRSQRPVICPPSGVLEVPLRSAEGEWLVENAAMAVSSGRRLTLVWDPAHRGAHRAVARRLAVEIGERRASRALRSCERQAARPELDREAVAA
jgi:hypothetical protein